MRVHSGRFRLSAVMRQTVSPAILTILTAKLANRGMSMTQRINADEKRLVNCVHVDVNQLMPLKYKWAWEHYRNGCANHWMPTEVPMQRDIELWKSNKLSADERLVIIRNLGFFSPGESL